MDGIVQSEATEAVCNCKDQYRTSLCPVCDVKKEDVGYEKTAITLTDTEILSTNPLIWEGHIFKCKKCGGQVMHDMKYCPGCGTRVDVRSRVVTAHINQMSARMKM